MHVVSVNVAEPRTIAWRGREVATGIHKSPRQGAVRVHPLGLEGDLQADKRFHGGPDKAVYAYPAEHYDFWRASLDDPSLPYGAFGENLTIAGVLEADAPPGTRLHIGSVSLVVTGPRTPCFKLGVRLGRRDAVRRFADSGRSGFYLRVAISGALAAGDPIRLAR